MRHLLPQSEIKIVTQPTFYSCVPACLSMVTGIPVEDIINDFKDIEVHQGVPIAEAFRWLVRHNILPAYLDLAYPCNNIYLCSVLSKTNSWKYHMVVITISTDETLNLLDPAVGEKYISADLNEGGDFPIS